MLQTKGIYTVIGWVYESNTLFVGPGDGNVAQGPRPRATSNK